MGLEVTVVAVGVLDARTRPLLPDVDVEIADGTRVCMAVAGCRTAESSRALLDAVGTRLGGQIPRDSLRRVGVYAALMELDARSAEGLSDLWRYAEAGMELYALND